MKRANIQDIRHSQNSTLTNKIKELRAEKTLSKDTNVNAMNTGSQMLFLNKILIKVIWYWNKDNLSDQ